MIINKKSWLIAASILFLLPTISMAKNDLTFANFRDTRDLNPHIYSGEMWAQNMIYESLVKYESDGTIKPWLAKSWQVSEDGKVYTFKLRDDVKFSDGVKFDAHVAKMNLDAVMSNKTRHSWLEMVRVIDNIQALDDETLQITLSSPYYPFLIELSVTRPMRFISPNSMIDGETKNGVKSYIGTGPYVMTEHKTDQYAVFTLNPYYWGEKPQIEKVTMKVIPDTQTRLMAFQKGEIELIYGKNMIDADSFAQISQNKKFTAEMSDPVSTRMILLNTTHDNLSDTRVRQAILHAVNKTDISEGIFNGSESVADTLLATNIPYANVGLKPYSFDPKEASTLLDQAGWHKVSGSQYRQKEGQRLTLHLYYDSNTASQKSVSEYMQDAFSEIGIELLIHGEEEQAYRDRQKAGNFDMIFDISWGLPYDPQSFMAGMKLPVYGDYLAQQGLTEKAQIDASITKALITTDEAERVALYRYVLTTLHNEAVYLPLTYERNRAVYSSNLHGVEFSASQFEIPFAKMYFTN